MSVFDCRMMAMFFTPIEPAAGLVRRMHALEQTPGVLSVSLIHGFPWGDTPAYGTRVLVITDDDPALGARIAEGFGREVVAERGRTMTSLIPVTQAVEMALNPTDECLVLADFADNAGAGSPSDATWLIGALMQAGIEDAAAAFVFDPVAVQIAKAAGVGAHIDLRVAGKTSSFSGPPLDLKVEVLNIFPDAIHDIGVVVAPLGDVAVVRAPGRFDLVLTTLRNQCFAPRGFSAFGVKAREKKVLVVKSMQHFYGPFRRLSSRIAYVDSPGVASLDLVALPFEHIDRSIWPFGEGRI
jgi:microcystin degradation protein MlrC